MRLIDEWREVLWRSATTWVTAALTFLVGALAQTYMAVFAFLAFVPSLAAQILCGGIVMLIVVGGPIILARLVQQPRLTAKIEEKRDGL
jgi:hypothetical protein